jgi:hypothetical protein
MSWSIIIGLGLLLFLAIELEKSVWRRFGIYHM